jgi:hypothetical protein
MVANAIETYPASDVPSVTLLEIDVTLTACAEVTHVLVTDATGGIFDILYHNTCVHAVTLAVLIS